MGFLGGLGGILNPVHRGLDDGNLEKHAWTRPNYLLEERGLGKRTEMQVELLKRQGDNLNP
jgi:hypothetical protein